MRAMKDSGIEWIGQIPQEWETKKLKFLVKLRTDKTADKTVPAPYVGLEHVASSAGTLIEDYEAILDFAGDTLDFKAGDVLFGKLRPYLAKAIHAETDGRCSSEFWVMDPQSIDGRFLLYAVLSHGFISCIDQSTFGVKMPRAEWEYAGNQELALPDSDTQRRIVEYLDRKCADIDALIAAKEKTNALLKERRQSIIYEAVTKGLNSDVPMKDSGIEWIGQIPEEWCTVRVKYTGSYKSGNTITAADVKESGNFPVYGGNGLRGYTDEITHDGDYLLIGRQGALCGNVHMVSGKFWASEHAVVGTINANYAIRYLFYALDVFDLNRLSTSAAQPGISVEQITSVVIPCPTFIEQQEIAIMLDVKCAEVDELISTNEALIQKLKEYRQSIIYEAVTGKIEV